MIEVMLEVILFFGTFLNIFFLCFLQTTLRFEKIEYRRTLLVTKMISKRIFLLLNHNSYRLQSLEVTKINCQV